MGAAIEVDHVSKHFKLYKEKAHSIKERVIKAGRLPYEEFWALRDVSFEVAQGETVGLLGHNGSGKSTLLKCIAGILRPTEGRILKHGRVAALLELGSGFHPELTGRENVFLNGSILGLTKAEVARVFDQVVAFAEIEQFIDMQVKHYSSGMYSRLAFAVAVNVDPEILLVDEVLSVGDERFQRKCLDRITQFQQEGRTILLVTHAADMVRQICDRAAVLDQGVLLEYGPPGEAVLRFRDALRARGAGLPAGLDDPSLGITHEVKITDVQVEYPTGQHHLRPGDPLLIRMAFDAVQPTDNVVFAINVFDQRGNQLLATNTDLEGIDVGHLDGNGEVLFRVDGVSLMDGVYEIHFGVHTHDISRVYDHRAGKDFLEVMSSGKRLGLVYFPLEIEIHAARPSEQPSVPPAAR